MWNSVGKTNTKAAFKNKLDLSVTDSNDGKLTTSSGS